MQNICVDFDGVIHEYHGWVGPDFFEKPITGAREFLAELSRKYQVVIHTTRDPLLVFAWLKVHELREFVTNVTQMKPPAVAYVDDRAVRFNGDFQAVLREVEVQPWWKGTGTDGGGAGK